MPNRLFTDDQVEYIEQGPGAVDPNNRWNFEQKIKKNATEGILQVLRLLPELHPFLNVERIQDEVNAAGVGASIGQLLTRDQRRQLAAMLIWGEQRPDESNKEFLERVPEIVDQYGGELDRELKRMQNAGGNVEFLRRISERLQGMFKKYIEEKRAEEVITIAVTVEELIEFATDRGDPDQPPGLPELLQVLYSDWQEGVQEKYRDCWQILLGIGMRADVESIRDGSTQSVEEQWGIAIFPTEEDIDQYLSVVDALEGEIAELVVDYFETERISAIDRVLSSAVDELEDLDRPAKDLLSWETLKNSRPEWKGHHTRRANIWTNDREMPLLALRKENEEFSEWEWTGYGELTRQLWKLEVDRVLLEEEGIPTGLEDDKLKEAVDELE